MRKPLRTYRAARSREAALGALGSSLVSGVAVIGLVGGLLLAFGQRTDRVDAAVDRTLPQARATATPRPAAPLTVAAGPAVPVLVESPPVEHPAPVPAARPAASPPRPAADRTPEVFARLPVVIFDEARHREVVVAFRTALRSAGWDVAGTGPWVGNVPVSTVYYPPGMKAAARELMSAFPSITRGRPAFPGVPTDKLTVIICEGFALGAAPTR